MDKTFKWMTGIFLILTFVFSHYLITAYPLWADDHHDPHDHGHDHDHHEDQKVLTISEAHTELSDRGRKVAELEIATVGPREIKNTIRVYGRLGPNEDKVSHVHPRFDGIIKQIHKSLGDTVAKGELLAVIESNQSLQTYEVRSQVKGVVVKRHATIGEFVSNDREIFIVIDLSEVWADFQVYRDDFGVVEVGQTISVDLGSGEIVNGSVTYISPITDEVTQSRLIRAILPNPQGTLRPGLFVSGILSSSDGSVAMAIKRDAVQTLGDQTIVYVTKDNRRFQAVAVKLGRKDTEYVEVLSGIKPGDQYVAGNSFLIKADIEKSGAGHDH